MRKLFFVLSCIFVILLAWAMSASAATHGDLSYTVSDEEVTITNCSTSDKSITIPEEIDGYPVTKIAEGAFDYQRTISSITIPSSITDIDYNAFKDCSNLKSVYITDIGAWCNIKFGVSNATPLYNGGSLYINGELAINIVIPDNITSIASMAFYNCTSIESITLPDSLTSINYTAFYGCSNLKSVYISDIETWCNIKFANESSNPLYNEGDLYINGELAKSVVIPENITSIGSYSFYKCANIENITIPDCVVSIGEYAFYNCINIENITIPDSVVFIGKYAFYNTAYYNNSEKWSNGFLYIGNHLIDASKLGYFQTNITNIKQGTKTIADSAFRDLTKIEAITIPDGVTVIGAYAFYGCAKLESIELPDSINRIGESAFSGTAYMNTPYNNYNGYYIGKHLISDKKSITSFTVRQTTKTIADKAFYCCDELSYITIPYGIVSIGKSAFNNCTKLVTVTIPSSVSYIGEDAFYQCANLESITVNSDNDFYSSANGVLFDKKKRTLIKHPERRTSVEYKVPDTVSSIEQHAFSNCDNLTITIPKSVTSINSSAFSDCNNLTINCEKGSVAQSFAVSNNIPYNIVEISGSTISGEASRASGKIVVFAEPSEVVSEHCLHIALYNDKNAMVDYIIVPTVKPLDHINVVFKDNPDASYAKIFLWNSIESLEPITEAVKIEIK